MNRGSVQCIEQEAWRAGNIFSEDHIDSNKHFCSRQSILEENIIIEEETKKDPFKLPYLPTLLFCAVLEDALVKMKCLEQCNNHLKIIKTQADIKYLTALKFSVDMPVVTDDLEEIDKKDLNNIIYKVKKLDADRTFVKRAMSKLYLELALHGTFYSLQECNQNWIGDVTYRCDLEADEAKNKIMRRDLAKQVRQQRIHIKSAIYDSDVTIDNLKSQVEDFLLITEIGHRYVGNWERARNEQHNKSIANIEKTPLSNISSYKLRFEHEIRVHNELEQLINIMISDTLAKIEEWMDKYDTDIEDIDVKIQVKKHDYQDTLQKRTDMEQKLEKRDQMMKDWIHFKEKREKERIYRAKMTNAAIVVQAWWRGLIVRCNLGPYRLKKKKEKKKPK